MRTLGYPKLTGCYIQLMTSTVIYLQVGNLQIAMVARIVHMRTHPGESKAQVWEISRIKQQQPFSSEDESGDIDFKHGAINLLLGDFNARLIGPQTEDETESPGRWARTATSK